MKVLMLNGSFNPDGSMKAGLDEMAKTFADTGFSRRGATSTRRSSPRAEEYPPNEVSIAKQCR